MELTGSGGEGGFKVDWLEPMFREQPCPRAKRGLSVEEKVKKKKKVKEGKKEKRKQKKQ